MVQMAFYTGIRDNVLVILKRCKTDWKSLKMAQDMAPTLPFRHIVVVVIKHCRLLCIRAALEG